MWHGDAIGRVLAAHGEDAGRARIAPCGAGSACATVLAPSLHALGAVGGRHRVRRPPHDLGRRQRVDHPGRLRPAHRPGPAPRPHRPAQPHHAPGGQPHRLLRGEAGDRLADHPRARRVVRWALRRLWRPVGAGVMPRGEVAFLIRTLFGDEAGHAMAARIDRRIDRLPGLADLRLVRGRSTATPVRSPRSVRGDLRRERRDGDPASVRPTACAPPPRLRWRRRDGLRDPRRTDRRRARRRGGPARPRRPRGDLPPPRRRGVGARPPRSCGTPSGRRGVPDRVHRPVGPARALRPGPGIAAVVAAHAGPRP